MKFLVDEIEHLRAGMRARNPFFRRLAHGELDGLLWVSPLQRQARGITQLMSLRAGLCTSEFRAAYAEHAAEEASHPDDLRQWMCAQGILERDTALSRMQHMATVDNLGLCAYVCLYEPDPVKVAVMNVVTEGVALDFYTAVIPALERMDRMSGPGSRYWRVHKAVDSVHMLLGTELCEWVTVDDPMGVRCRDMALRSMSLYDSMLESWAEY